MKPKIPTIIFATVFLCTLCFFCVNSMAGTYWVSTQGSASWSGAKSSTPLSGNKCTTLSTANKNASAGDIVYLRAGTYNTGIKPSKSGTSRSNTISFMAFSGETVTITNQTQVGILLSNKKYIKVHGIDVLAPIERLLTITKGASFNEIAYCNFSGRGSAEPPKIWDGKVSGGSPCKHNWIHHCTFTYTGSVSNKCNDHGGTRLGGASYDNHSNNNTIENCIFYCGGHHNLETFTKFNVVRNNLFHNEGCMLPPKPCAIKPDSKGYYGNRNISIYDGHNSDGMFNLFEGNRFGHAGRPPDDHGAFNVSIAAPKNIVRHNTIFNGAHAGIYFKMGHKSYGNYNRVYNNTVFHNGRNEAHEYKSRAGVVFSSGTKSLYTKGNVLKNNIVYDNHRDFSTRGGGASLKYQIIENNWSDYDGNPRFINSDISDPFSLVLPDLRLRSGSPAINKGTHLTEAVGGGSNSTKLIVKDALYFQDGTWGSSLSSIEADSISIGFIENTVKIKSIDYSNNIIHLSSPAIWSDKAKVWLAKKSNGKSVLKGSAPDMGAHEYGADSSISLPKDPKFAGGRNTGKNPNIPTTPPDTYID